MLRNTSNSMSGFHRLSPAPTGTSLRGVLSRAPPLLYNNKYKEIQIQIQRNTNTKKSRYNTNTHTIETQGGGGGLS